MSVLVDRRLMLAGLASLLAGCAAPRGTMAPGTPRWSANPALFVAYGPLDDNGHHIPALDPAEVDPDHLRQQVPYAGPYRPGTIVVDIPERRLYLVQPGGVAMRYTVGVGREEALNFRGAAVVGRKAEWPRWTPTATMMATMPRYRAYAGGMAGGIGNPLGARALYLYRDGRDTYFRLHGTNEPSTIGTKVSSGCIRLFNHDIIDLYNRVPVGARVVVLQGPEDVDVDVANAGPPGTAVGPAPDVYEPAAPYDPYGPAYDVGPDVYGAPPSYYGPGY